MSSGRNARAVSNLDKVLYPEAGFTKGEVIDYYVAVADALLPHLADRLLTRKRWPDGTGSAAVLREEHAARHARLGPHRLHGRARRRRRRVRRRRRPARPWSGSPTSPRSSCTCRSGRSDHDGGPQDADLARLRPRPGRRPPTSSTAATSRSRCGSCSRHDGLTAYPKTSGNKGAQLYVPIEPATSRRVRRSTPRSSPTSSPQALPDLVRLVDGQEGAQGQGLHRLEPEQRRQDHHRAVLAARDRPPDGLDAAHLGRGRPTPRRRPTCASSPPTWSAGSTSTATCSADMPDTRGTAALSVRPRAAARPSTSRTRLGGR